MQSVQISRCTLVLSKIRKCRTSFCEIIGKPQMPYQQRSGFVLSRRYCYLHQRPVHNHRNKFYTGNVSFPSKLQWDKQAWTCFYSVLPNHKHSYSNNGGIKQKEKQDNLDKVKPEVSGEPTQNPSDNTAKDSSHESRVLNNQDDKLGEKKADEIISAMDEKIKESVFKRFRTAYKEHGKTLLLVHCATSLVWFGSFYYAAASGMDVHAILQKIGLPDSIITPLSDTQLGNVALAYIMYKIATPARYTVTLTGTNFAIKYLKSTGRIKEVPQGDSLRDLIAESRDSLSETTKEWTQIVEDRTEQLRKESKGFIDEHKDKFGKKN